MSPTRERVVVFGPGQCLMGVLCEPGQGAKLAGAPAVLMANVGVNHRVGPNRIWVELSRSLAAAGIPALRFDMSGLGDSGPRPGTETELERGRLDVTDAMDVLVSRGIADRFVLVALCSGVDAAHVVARDDSRVIGAAFIDGYTHRTAGWYIRHYSVRFLALRRWRIFLASVVDRLRNGPPPPNPAPIYTRQYPDVATLEHDMQLMVDRKVSLLCVFTAEVDSHYNHADQFYRMFRRDFRPHILVDHLVQADHVFFNGIERARLIARLKNWAMAVAVAAPAAAETSQQPRQ